jgi:two-component system, NtrC family, sensor kinase
MLHPDSPDNSSANRRVTLRLLQVGIVAALVLPMVLFVFASAVSYRNISAIADERAARALDVLQEQALKVFRSIDATLDTLEELVADRTNQEIADDHARLQQRFKRMAAAFPEIQSIWLFDQAGRALVTTVADPPPAGDYAHLDFFRAHMDGGKRRFIGEVTSSTFGGQPYFGISRARHATDKTFAGVIEVSVVPSDFYRFYAELVNTGGLQYALIRDDGTMLARYPRSGAPPARLNAQSGFGKTIAANAQGGAYAVASQVDGITRRFAVRKIPEFPLYVSAGIETASIRSEWLNAMGAHLFFGIPATLLLAGSLFYILRRTQHLHEEQDRREAAEDALRQTQKMEAIGHLTGGVAHDFNNLLTIIIGNLERAERQAAALAGEAHERLQHAIANAMTGARRAATLTQRLLAFSRQAPHKPERIDPNKLLTGLSDFLTRSLGEKVSLETVGAAGLWACEVDRSELEAALVNLAVNARDAMPDGGKLTVESSNAYLDEAYCRQYDEVRPGQYVLISVTDTGTGMSPELARQAIEPFFTTKPPGQGTGLGLSQVYGFVKQSGGHFKIYSEPGEGTTVKMYLPRAAGQMDVAKEPPEPPVVPGAGESILVVEDDADVRTYVVETLRELKYRVQHASSAEDALRLIDGQAVDLLLTDVVLPGINGRRLAEELTGRQPSLKVIYMTGYSRNAIVHQGRLDAGLEMLQKPLTSSDLARAVGKVLKSG